MIGRIIYRREKGRAQPAEERLCGLSVLDLFLFEPPELPTKKLDKRLGKLERTFRKAEISRVIVPEHFPYLQKNA